MKQEIKIQIPEGTQFDTVEVSGNLLITTFKEKKTTIDDLSTFETCCKFLGHGTELPNVSNISPKHKRYIQALYTLAIINEAWNKIDEFVPDYSDSNQRKCYPWFEFEGSAFAFYYSDYVRSIAYAGSGSRLVFKSEERAKQFGNMFIDLHNEVLLIG